MIVAKKVRIKPTPEQEVLFRKSAGTARWAYNYYIAEASKVYQQYVDAGYTGKKEVTDAEINKYITNELKNTTHTWLWEVGSATPHQAVRDARVVWRRYLTGKAGKPHFKDKHKTTPSFYVSYTTVKKVNGGFTGQRLGFVRASQPLPDIPEGKSYSNPRISYDGKYWYLSVGYEINEEECEKTGESIGIDLGVKNLATCSNGDIYGNINKTHEVMRLEKVLQREQKKLNRMLLDNTSGYDDKNGKRVPIYKKPLSECKNIQKQKKAIKRIYRRLKNIRLNYLHQTTTKIVKAKPSRVVMEKLNIQGLMKNKHLSKAIQDQKMYEFKRQMMYKCQKYGIEFVEVPITYPSSKTCSCCGHVKDKLKLSERVYICEECGAVIDRDLNASINLANYKTA